MSMKNIVLTGFMGTGKTEVGMELARRLNIELVDTDSLIELQEKQTISEIFSQKGEAYFRRLEKEIIERVSKLEGRIIATGGGAIIDHENRDNLRRNGTIICLSASPGVIRERTLKEGKRPLLTGEDPDRRIKELMERRMGFYAQSDYIVDTSNLSISEVADEILKYLESIKSITVELEERSYQIIIRDDSLAELGFAMRRFGLKGKALLVSNPLVNKLYGAVVKESLGRAGFEVEVVEVPDGEEAKSLSSASRLYDEMLDFEMDRTSTVVALGGGVIGDLAGFVAATYMRGIPYVQVPTTLLAQVDSSVGGKTAINHPRGKNMIGAFYQPRLVLIDPITLKTLAERELKAGLVEVIKHGLIVDKEFFEYLERNIEQILSLRSEFISDTIFHSLEIKAEVVEKDEKEAGIRAILNFGHTIGHAIEAITDFERYRHGEAIAIGMIGASRISEMSELCPLGISDRLSKLLTKIGLPTCIEGLKAKDILTAMRLDKKRIRGKLRYILLKDVGEVMITDDVPEDIIRKALLLQGAI